MKNLKKSYYIGAPPIDVWHALTNPVTLQLWTGEPAMMSTEPGSEFSLWDGAIEGCNLEFTEGEKLVQEWYFGDQEPASIVTITLKEKGTGTQADLLHTSIPDEDFRDICDGWDESYFGALKEFYRE
jgi:uncharacterized protein YndB with AHSA1/START domain